MATDIPSTEIELDDFTGDALKRSITILKNEATGEFYFDYVEYPEDFDFDALKFYRVEAKSVAEVEAAVRRIIFGEDATATTGEDGKVEDDTGDGAATSAFSSGVSGIRTAAGLPPPGGMTASSSSAFSSPPGSSTTTVPVLAPPPPPPGSSTTTVPGLSPPPPPPGSSTTTVPGLSPPPPPSSSSGTVVPGLAPPPPPSSSSGTVVPGLAPPPPPGGTARGGKPRTRKNKQKKN